MFYFFCKWTQKKHFSIFWLSEVTEPIQHTHTHTKVNGFLLSIYRETRDALYAAQLTTETTTTTTTTMMALHIHPIFHLHNTLMIYPIAWRYCLFCLPDLLRRSNISLTLHLHLSLTGRVCVCLCADCLVFYTSIYIYFVLNPYVRLKCAVIDQHAHNTYYLCMYIIHAVCNQQARKTETLPLKHHSILFIFITVHL